jgi:hypothetical protein
MNYQPTWHASGGEGASISETAIVPPKEGLEAIADGMLPTKKNRIRARAGRA